MRPRTPNRTPASSDLNPLSSIERVLAAIALAALTMVYSCTAGTFGQNAAALASEDSDLRRESALALGQAHVADDALRAKLIRRLEVLAQSDPDPLVRSAALTALVEQDSTVAVDVARRIRTDRCPLVRRDVVRVLSRYGDDDVVAPLLEMVEEDGDPATRRDAALALGAFHRPEAIEVLIGRLADPDEVRKMGVNQIATLIGVLTDKRQILLSRPTSISAKQGSVEDQLQKNADALIATVRKVA